MVEVMKIMVTSFKRSQALALVHSVTPNHNGNIMLSVRIQPHRTIHCMLSFI